MPIEYVLKMFKLTLQRSQYLIAHNITFDKGVVGAECLRYNMPEVLENIKLIDRIDTMKKTIDFCAIPSQYGFKFPKLSELYFKLFGRNFEDAHDALVDVRAMVECFFELKKREIIK